MQSHTAAMMPSMSSAAPDPPSGCSPSLPPVIGFAGGVLPPPSPLPVAARGVQPLDNLGRVTFPHGAARDMTRLSIC